MEGKRHVSRAAGLGSKPDALEASCWYGVPGVPDNYVRRDRLLTLLDRAASRPLVLVSAPAGSGKTSLMADWVSARADHHTTEWVTFERGEDAFWPGMLGGLSRLGVGVPSRSLPSGTGSVARGALTALAMAVARHPDPVTLVLDGYEMESREVAADLDYLLRHSGHRLHLVLVTRVDPILPLYRYRLEDTLVEVRMADLAFTDDEAEQLLTRAGVRLSAEAVRALNERTHGWVAGLRFSSKFLDQSDDPDLAVAQVAGDRGDIGEYLMGEVLAAQTPENRDLLLSTSIPDTIAPGLAEELGGRSASRILSFLARVNAFVEPVPEHPGYYRYHPFFRDLLRAELAYEAPQEMERLQRATAEWFAREGLLAAAVGHYAEIEAWAEAAETVVDELAVGELLMGTSEGALARTLMSIPDEVREPAASVVRAALALAHGDPQRYAAELARVPDPTPGPVDGHAGDGHPGDGHAEALSLAVAVLRTVRARAAADPREAIEAAEEAEQALSDRDEHLKAQAHQELLALVHASKGIAALRRGQLREAHALFTAGSEAAMGLGSEALLVECRGYLALIACVRDQLSAARALATDAVAAAEAVGIRASSRPSAAQVALAWVDMERYQLSSAGAHLKLADLSDPLLGDPVPTAMLALVRSRLQVAHGDLAGALATVESASAEVSEDSGWLAAQLHLEAAHLRVLDQDTPGAVSEVSGLEQLYPAEAALVMAEARLVEGDDDASQEALTLALAHGNPRGVQVAAWLVEASRQLQRGSTTQAKVALDRSMRLAAPEGLRRPFREAPPSLANLLPSDTALGRELKPVRRPEEGMTGARWDPGADAHPSTVVETLVVERLTEKELEVLGHLAELLTTEEIADAMFVSVNTTRTHVRNILRKLGVPRRNAAVRRARELDLLPR